MYDGVDVRRWYKFGIDVYEVEEINKEIDLLKMLSPDLVVMCGWRQIVDRKLLGIPKIGFIGFHPTLLPIGRGPAPIINSILHDFRESGVTMFYISADLDSGDIIAQEKFNIKKTDHAIEVYKKVIKAGKQLIRKYLPRVLVGTAPRIPQDESKVIYFKKPDLKCNEIDLKKDSIEVMYKKIKAFSKPYLGAYIKKNGKKLIIWRAELIE